MKYKPGQAVEVVRAGFFGGIKWVRATYAQQIGDYHTVKEYGGSYSDEYIRAAQGEF